MLNPTHSLTHSLSSVVRSKCWDRQEAASIFPTYSWKISDRGNIGVGNVSLAPKFPKNGGFLPPHFAFLINHL